MFQLMVGDAHGNHWGQRRVFPPGKTGGMTMKRTLCIVLTAILLLLLLPARASGEESSTVARQDIEVYARVTGEASGDPQQQTPSGSQTETDPSTTQTDPTTGGETPQTADPVYSVELIWGNMTFDYARNSAEPWSIPEGKDGNGLAANEIRITNQSTAAIRYRASFAPAKAEYPLTGSLIARKWNQEAEPCQYTYTALPAPGVGDNLVKQRHIDHVFLTVSGTLPSSLSPGVVQVGKVTVEIVPDAE